jgi:protein TonB
LVVQRASMAVLYGVSFALHASLGVGVAEIEPAREPERIAISMVDVPKPKPKKEEPPPPPPPPPVEAPKPRAVARAKAAEPPPETAPAPVADVPTFGIAMTGGVGQGGIAVPVGDSLGAAKEPVKRVAQAKTLAEAPKKQVLSETACDEPQVKPKPVQLSRPEYTEEARAAGIEGKVRVELTVDADGVVRNVKVLESLGHGLDEAAIASVQAATFEPALLCGKPVDATFVVSIRFSL